MRATVSVNFVDGSFVGPDDYDDAFVAKLLALESRGVSGHEIIDALLGDDWAAPPLRIVVRWRDTAGQSQERRIAYD
jgi:hypothetical protein